MYELIKYNLGLWLNKTKKRKVEQTKTSATFHYFKEINGKEVIMRVKTYNIKDILELI